MQKYYIIYCAPIRVQTTPPSNLIGQVRFIIYLHHLYCRVDYLHCQLLQVHVQLICFHSIASNSFHFHRRSEQDRTIRVITLSNLDV